MGVGVGCRVGRRRYGLVGALVVVVGGGGERRRANSEEVGGSHALAGRDRDRIGGGRPSLSLGLRGRFPARDGLGSGPSGVSLAAESHITYGVRNACLHLVPCAYLDALSSAKRQ